MMNEIQPPHENPYVKENVSSDVENEVRFSEIKPATSEIVPKMAKKIAIFCLMTGIFAVVGALYRWGEGPLFLCPAGTDVELFYAEIVICGPVSFIASTGYWKMKKWGMFAGLVATGIYLYGSVMVYVSLFHAGFPISLELVIPPIFGIWLSVVILKWSWKYLNNFN